MSADDALARAKEIAARLSGSSVPAPVPQGNALDVANAAQAAVAAALQTSSNGSNAHAIERKRKRWGTSDDSAAAASKEALPGLEMVEKKLKAATEPVQKRVWVNTSQKPAAHFVSFLKGPNNTKPQEIIAQVGGGDDLQIHIKGRGSTNAAPLPGMPEEPLHVLIEGPPDKAQKAETMIEDLLREAENAPVTVAAEPASQTDGGNAQNQQLAESIAARAADALAAAMNTGAAAASAPSPAGYKPAPVAQLIGHGNPAAAGIYGPAGGSGETFEEQIGVPNGVVGFIIGRGGESISNMQARSGCRVQIQKEHEMTPGQTQRVITLTASSKESIDMCRGIIEGMVQERIRSAGGSSGGMGMPAAAGGAASQSAKLQEAIAMGHVLVTVQVPDADVGLIIGKAGANIRSIQDRSGANVQIPQIADADNPSVRTVNVTHPHPEGANLAKQLIEDLLRSKASNQGGAGASITLQVPIPDKDVGMCIGRSGCVIREMQSKSGTRIQIPSQPTPGQTHRIATVTGPQEGCQQVQQMINMIIQEQSSQSVMSGANYTAGYNAYGQQYGQQQAYGQQYGAAYGHQQQAAAGGQKDYSAEWAAYYAAQAAAQQSGTPAAAAPADTASAATPAPASGTNGDAQPAADAYYDQFFRYAYHYGEEAARKYYGAWSPPAGTPNPYGTNPNASAPADAAQAAPAPASAAQAAPASSSGGTSAAAIAASMGARDTSVRKQSNLPAWMTKGTS